MTDKPAAAATPPDKPPAARADDRGIAERTIETILFNSRWLLTPFYLALVVTLLVLMFKALQHMVEFILHAPRATEAEVILGVLALVDLTLTGSLIIIVVFSGYENFVSKIEADEHKDWPEWMGKIDFTGLKQKLLSSIVAISAVKLLTAYMNIHKYTDRDLAWLAGIHVMFVVSGVFMALTDKLSGEAKASKQ